MSLSELGPFEAVIETGFPVYLTFLHLDGKEVQVALSRIRNAIQEAGNPKKYIRLLLKDRGWRLHLVGAVAILLTDDVEHRCTDELWSAIDGGSWVVPQLAVTALFTDKQFAQQARRRIEALLSSMEPSFAGGSTGGYASSPKALASLLAVGNHVPSQREWVQVVSQGTKVQEMLRDDDDRANEIAEQWLRCALHQFGKFGIDLKPAAT